MAEKRGTEQSTAGFGMERIVRNGAVFREANEGIREAAEEHLEGDERVPFVCECADQTCHEILHLTLAEYQLIRSDPRLFVNVDGHQAAAHGWAEAIAGRDSYVVVETIGLAGDLAEELEGEELLSPRGRPCSVQAAILDERQRRIGQNEALFRKVNERLNDVQDAFSAFTGVLEIVCECGNLSCGGLLSITPDHYEHLRREATWFAVIPGHEVVAVEQVVMRREGYNIVQKRPGPAAEEAEATGPRS